MSRGWSLIELMVVCCILGTATALSSCLVQTARESARRLHCENNLKQIGLAAQHHCEAHGYFPTGGWGWGVAGDPNLGFGSDQPGGWLFTILPYLERENLHAMGMDDDEPTRREQGRLREEIPVAEYVCPSRRTVRAYPYPANGNAFSNINKPTLVIKSDYAANAGDGEDTTRSNPPRCRVGSERLFTGQFSQCSGVVYQKSEVSPAMILDGTRNTMLIGEKYLNPDHYAANFRSNDDQSAYVGFDADVVRFTDATNPLSTDFRGKNLEFAFGSAHGGGIVQTFFCDGSVRVLHTRIDAEVFQHMGNRNDGHEITGWDKEGNAP